VVGKTNLDQFASGLVGTRSPYGVAPNAFDDRFIPGGSSSGSASAVGGGLVCFALGTDTAGSGRVPAGYNGCVGIKPTLGAFSTVGVVPACAALDCVTVFARSVPDAAEVARLMRAAAPPAGTPDAWRRAPAPARPPPAAGAPFRFGMPGPEFLEWDGACAWDRPARWSQPLPPPGRRCVPRPRQQHAPPLTPSPTAPPAPPPPGGPEMAAASAKEFAAAAARLQSVGGQLVAIDFAPFAEIAAMLYQSSFVAERYSGLRAFLDAGPGGGAAAGSAKRARAEDGGGPGGELERQRALNGDERLLPVTRAIISGAGAPGEGARAGPVRRAGRRPLPGASPAQHLHPLSIPCTSPPSLLPPRPP
jgi:allophanate hydrolase